MNYLKSKNARVLGIAPTARGVGFAVMEGKDDLVDWGLKTVKGDKNARSLSHVGNLISLYDPTVVALEDCQAKESRRSSRIRALIQEIISMAEGENIRVMLFSRRQLSLAFTVDGKGTKHAQAEYLADRFPEELSFQLPPKRKAWTTVDYRMDIFDAVALARRGLGEAGYTGKPRKTK